MAGNTRATTFVTGSDGFLGSAETIRRIGAMPVIGHPLTPGRWQDEAAAEWVLHLATPIDRGRSFLERAATMAHARSSLDANLLEAVSSGATPRIAGVSDGSGYGAAGSRPVYRRRAASPVHVRPLARPGTRSPKWPEYPQADAVLSNIRLRAKGFRFEHPTLEDGVRQVLRALHE